MSPTIHLTDGAMEGHDPGHGPSFTRSSIKHLALFSRNEDTDTHWRRQNGNVSIQTVSLKQNMLSMKSDIGWVLCSRNLPNTVLETGEDKIKC